VMLSSCAWCLFPNICSFKVHLATLPLVQFFRQLRLTVQPVWLCPLHRATPAWRVIILRVPANFLCDPALPWVRLFGWLRQHATRCQSLCYIFGAPKFPLWPVL
jgi:hypothetical protein